MRDFVVTGIRYQMGDHLTELERKDAAVKLVTGLENGTKVLLMAEPDNPKDSNAVAVYLNYSQVGYISSGECTEAHNYLDENGQVEAEVCGNDGHITFFIKMVDNSHNTYESMAKRPRILPESPLDKSVLMPFSKKERTLETIIHPLLNTPIDDKHASQLYEMVCHYVPVSRLSICHSDDYWRRAVYERIVDLLLHADELGYTDEQQTRLHDLKTELKKHSRDMHRVCEQPIEHLFAEHLDNLQNDANCMECLLTKYQQYYLNKTFAEADPKKLAAEYERLSKWFQDMPWGELRNPKDLDAMALKLNYLGISRRELYDIFSVLVIINHLDMALPYNARLTDELKSEKAQKYWIKLQEEGFVDKYYMLTPGTTRQMAMLIADKFAERINVPYKWNIFEKLWGINYLAQEKQKYKDYANRSPRFNVIESIFK